MPQKFWMVWLNNSPTTQRRHTSAWLANSEADRIAQMPENSGEQVYVLQAINTRRTREIPKVTPVEYIIFH